MSKLSVYVIAYNDEPDLPICAMFVHCRMNVNHAVRLL